MAINVHQFRDTVLTYYRKHKRDLPWRETTDPYRIVVSEVMLQQTQVPRVLSKYPEFLEKFPNFSTLASASLSEVLLVWQGMGYNRRGKYLKQLAEVIVQKYNGELPHNPILVDELPGIGPATAASICAFAFNLPTVFIETNIRRVFIHHLFQDQIDIPDTAIYPLVQQTLDTENPRDWYYALMDYGTYLGKTLENPNKRSRHYTIQSKFEGSDRQIRGAILRLLLKKSQSREEIIEALQKDQERVITILKQMKKEAIIQQEQNLFFI
ncbi:A/G-specific adenine glycosylase [Candidatus Roizmanbacteria bacterium]|nr:A/G-specific adenine glycosylase [Candidatus Roizmanbacteria bacterium]